MPDPNTLIEFEGRAISTAGIAAVDPVRFKSAAHKTGSYGFTILYAAGATVEVGFRHTGIGSGQNTREDEADAFRNKLIAIANGATQTNA